MRSLGGSFLIVLLILTTSSCRIGRAVFWNKPDLRDGKKFASTLIKNNKQYIYNFDSTGKLKYPLVLTEKTKRYTFDSFLKRNNTVAILIIQNDTIRYEKYYRGYSSRSLVPTFSIAKSFTAALIGCAIQDGFINSIDQPVTDFIPELRKRGLAKVTIRQLLQMTSGLNFKEQYFNPFGKTTAYYYGKNTKKSMSRLRSKHKPGEYFYYSSANTQLLGWVLERALKEETISNYLGRKMWMPLGMESSATWNTDKPKGLEKTFCCINARARDVAKFGKLYLQNGMWENQQIISKEWVHQSLQPDSSKQAASFYGFGWWLNRSKETFMSHGILGQCLYINPNKSLIIVRLGSGEGGVDWFQMFDLISEGY